MTSGGNASGQWVRRAMVVVVVVVAAGYVGMWVLGQWVGAAKGQVETASCSSNMHILLRAVRMYADDYEGRFPLGNQWADGTAPYVDVSHRYTCPTVRTTGGSFGYAMNKAVSGILRDRADAKPDTPMLYDSSTLKPNACDLVQSLPVPGRHITRAHGDNVRGNVVGRADGGAAFRKDAATGR